MNNKEKIYQTLWLPSCMLLAIWTVFICEKYYAISLSNWGLFPRTLEGLRGIIFSPFLHGSWEHLISNSGPIWVLLWLLRYYYQKSSIWILLFLAVLSGLITWVIGRPSYHIGASSLIYGLASFLFFSGLVKGVRSMLAASLIIAFLYGGLWWGLLPLEEGVSWEGHVGGFFAGMILTPVFISLGPKREIKRWEEEEEDDDESELPWNQEFPYPKNKKGQ